MTIDPLAIATGAVTTAGAWLWDKYGKELIDKLGDTTKAKWSKFSGKRAWLNAAKTYHDNLLRQHSTIRVFGKSQPVLLEGIFTDVYILNELTARQRYNIEALESQYVNRFKRNSYDDRENGIKLIGDDKNLFILGKPGAGKTTFLRYVVLQSLQGRIDKVPIFISLKEWSTSGCQDIMSFIVDQFEICNFPDAQSFIEHLLQAGRVIVLFDGLDEVNQENNQRSDLTTLLQNFSKQYYRCQYLITCRIAASEYEFEHFQDVEIADFTEEQVKAFVNKWFHNNEEKRKLFLTEFYKSENKGLQELASIPLLLTLLCLSFDATNQWC